MASSRKKKSPPVEDLDLFDCTLCKGVEGLEMSDFKKHRREVHDAPEFKGSMKMLMHMDGEDWYASTYEVFGPTGQKIAIRSCMNRRKGADLRQWQGR